MGYLHRASAAARYSAKRTPPANAQALRCRREVAEYRLAHPTSPRNAVNSFLRSHAARLGIPARTQSATSRRCQRTHRLPLRRGAGTSPDALHRAHCRSETPHSAAHCLALSNNDSGWSETRFTPHPDPPRLACLRLDPHSTAGGRPHHRRGSPAPGRNSRQLGWVRRIDLAAASDCPVVVTLRHTRLSFHAQPAARPRLVPQRLGV